MMTYVLIIIALLAVPTFIFLPPRYKVFFALFAMTACFNLLPGSIFGIVVWDAGAVMLVISGIHLLFAKPKAEPIRTRYLTILKVFICWLWLSLLWALVVYHYPVLNTLKASRLMIIGYMSIFVFLRLFRVDPGAFDFLWKTIYWTTFVFMIVCIVQSVLNIQFLFLLEREYEGAMRRLPSFLPFSLMYFWVISAKLLSGTRTKLHEKLYLLMTIFITATTYTRGIYFTVFVILMAMIAILQVHRRLQLMSALVLFCAFIIVAPLLLATGSMDKVIKRASSGLALIASSGDSTAGSRRKLDDSYSGRMEMVRERFALVVEKNPLFGYAFVHDLDVPPALNARLQHMHGSVKYTEQLKKMYASGGRYVIALHSADAGWANMLLDAGIAGFLIFIAFVYSIAVNFVNQKRSVESKYYFIELGLFLQVLALVFFMFNGTPYISSVQIPAFMIAGYALCTMRERNVNLQYTELETIP